MLMRHMSNMSGTGCTSHLSDGEGAPRLARPRWRGHIEATPHISHYFKAGMIAECV